MSMTLPAASKQERAPIMSNCARPRTEPSKGPTIQFVRLEEGKLPGLADFRSIQEGKVEVIASGDVFLLTAASPDRLPLPSY
jgi:hypothetical protein